MTVAGHCERVREGVTLLYEDLVANATTGGVEVDAMLPREGFNSSVLGQVLRRLVLNVVVEGENQLLGIVYARGTY